MIVLLKFIFFSFDAYGDPINKGASILKFKDGCWVFYKAFEPP